MKTKYKIAIIGTVLGSTMLCSCEDTLNLVPKSALAPETYFRKAEDLELATNRFYLLLPDFESIDSEPSDLVIDKGQPNSLYYTNLRPVPGSGGGWSWGTLRHINYYLEHSSNCEDLEARNHYDAVAKFFRAWFYFDKVKRYGDVPWHNKPIDAADKALLSKPRDSRKLIVDSILRDLDFAEKFLPTTSDGFHLNKDIAAAFRSRVCLFEGTFRKYHAGDLFNPDNLPWEDLLKDAVESARRVMDTKRYSIVSSGDRPYYNLFVKEEADQREYIFSRSYGGSVTTSIPNSIPFSGGGGCQGATKAFVASFLMKDGTRFTDKAGWDKMETASEFKDRDPRLSETVIGPGSGKWSTGENMDYKILYSETCYPLMKSVQGPAMQKSGTQDMPVIRYAEILLNYAEAQAELGVLTQNDLDKTINLLRGRVKMPNLIMADANANPDPFLTSEDYGYVNVPDGPNKGVVLEIRRERSIELVKEGLRWPDLMRWREGHRMTKEFYGAYFKGPNSYDMDGDGKKDFAIYKDRPIRVPGVTPKKIGTDIYLSEENSGFVIGLYGITHAFNENRDYLFPLPSDDIKLTDGTLTQNPNW